MTQTDNVLNPRYTRGHGLESRARASRSPIGQAAQTAVLQRGGQPGICAQRDWAKIGTDDEPRFTPSVTGLFRSR